MIRISNAWPYNVIHWVFFFLTCCNWLLPLLFCCCCKVYNWFLYWWPSLVPWSFYSALCTSWLQRKTWICCMHSSCKCFVVQYLFFLLHEDVIYLFYYLYKKKKLSIYFIFFLDDSMYWYELQCIVLLVAIIDLWDWSYLLKLAIYAYFLNLWLVLWHSSRKK